MSSYGLAPADLEAAVVSFYGGDCGTVTPNPMPDYFTRVNRAGGTTLNLVQTNTRLLVEVWGPQDDDGTLTYPLVREQYARLSAAVPGYVGGVFVASIALTDPVNFPDVDLERPHFQFVANLTNSLTEVPA